MVAKQPPPKKCICYNPPALGVYNTKIQEIDRVKAADRFLLRASITLPSFFFGCYAATQLALQLQSERTQVLCSNREARKCTAQSTPGMDLNHMNEV